MSVYLIMKASDGQEREFQLRRTPAVIGREPTCDVRVPVLSVSHKHCQISFDNGELKLKDLESEGGTFHNGRRVQTASLAHEDTLQVGPVTFVVKMQKDDVITETKSPEVVVRRDRRDAESNVGSRGTEIPPP